MSNINIIYSVGIYQGGGLIILKEFIKNCKNSFFYFDSRLNPSFYKDIKLYKIVRNNFFSKLILMKKLSKMKKNIYFINGLPPIFKYEGIVSVLFQNVNIFPKKKIIDFLYWIFSKDFLRFIIYILGQRNIYLWIVLSDVAEKNLIKNLSGVYKILKVNFFDYIKLKKNIKKKTIVKKYDFIYPADLKKHKNHKILFKALLELSKKKIYPSFLFTFTNDEIKKINFDKLKLKINIHNYHNQLDRSKFLKKISQSKCLFYPSLNETLGIPIIEAFQQNLIIAAANKDYSSQFIKPNYLFNPNSVNSIKKTIKKIYFTNKIPKNKLKINLYYYMEKNFFFKKYLL